VDKDSDDFEKFLKTIDGALEEFARAHGLQVARNQRVVLALRSLRWKSRGLHRQLSLMSGQGRNRVSVHITAMRFEGSETLKKVLAKHYAREEILNDTLNALEDCFAVAESINEGDLKSATELEKDRQEALAAPTYRKIYFKLPLRQTEFHWRFLDREAFLAGRLVLLLQGKDKQREIIVFEKGDIAEGWAVIETKKAAQDGIYFGFVSKIKFLTSINDTVDIQLDVVADLNGIGSENRGILKAGKYSARSGFTIYDPDGTAYTGDKNCSPLWDLVITDNRGWMADRKANEG